ncbi:hypothetical protein PENTCL1PPCAC_27711 [Pristionchus entomophagus]|uniref:Transmembrane protein n=1 Tax=Pristionchus entomophagus TaxID=358040 RepID=A0AAV5UG24_9BILA|nr:hypothetical protein PENTCL1PPCAC_27711 [Pristionchus entomophagus]
MLSSLPQQMLSMGVPSDRRQQDDVAAAAAAGSLPCNSCSSSEQSSDGFTVVSADSAAPLHDPTRVRTAVVLKEFARFRRVWRGLQPVPDYRLWIYSVNGLIITFQCLVGYLAYSSWRHPFWKLIPLHPSSLLYIAFATIFCVQWFACVCGLIGVFVSSRDFIKIYWCLMIPLLFMDVIQFVVASYQLMKVHVYFSSSILNTNSSLCPVWIELASEFSCSTDCAPSELGYSCTFALLRWMHSRLDIVGVLMCFVLFPLKIIVILALREDIQELFEEIVYSDNQRLYKHWALGDDEEDESDQERENAERENRQATNVFAA